MYFVLSQKQLIEQVKHPSDLLNQTCQTCQTCQTRRLSTLDLSDLRQFARKMEILCREEPETWSCNLEGYQIKLLQNT